MILMRMEVIGSIIRIHTVALPPIAYHNAGEMDLMIDKDVSYPTQSLVASYFSTTSDYQQVSHLRIAHLKLLLPKRPAESWSVEDLGYPCPVICQVQGSAKIPKSEDTEVKQKLHFGDSEKPSAPPAKSGTKPESEAVTPLPLTVSGCTHGSDPQMSAEKLKKLQEELAGAKEDQKKKKKEEKQELKKKNTEKAETEKNESSKKKENDCKVVSVQSKSSPQE